mmetsp:Transcript_13037/g.36102  ORF Transcript_13037/g.36102 Transcript_13037/m.36102 type:complete len:442 (-) Transcript_13037:181-1506(-)|eukprot:CAMPEP_0168750114 /NCGR_PEP_ID=MMETSP0724-20121128/17086_1 /TAXON_ID=265536 /ORGANISM="Amphiprora sp., Strain CCMP467" /LENGTH=441 /DNA_ID=CAMNT_0008798087 /DNA_START=40 /DNA_END=1365 /DNA_ORIENTATION=-
MKLASIVLLAVASTAAAKSQRKNLPRYQTPGDISADSELGQKILNKARRVQDYNDYNSENYFYDADQQGYSYDGVNYNPNAAYGNGGNDNAEAKWYMNWQLAGSKWLKGYAIKFQGCYDTFKWNKEAEDAESVRLEAQHLVRFRLCPMEYCGTNSNNGCRNNFGDYIIDLDTFLESYLAAKEVYQEWQQQVAADQEYAEGEYEGQDNWEYNPEANFDLQDYMYCQDSGIPMQSNDYMQVYGYEMGDEDYYAGNNNNNQYLGSNYYIGPYCGSQGGTINMGFFKDASCSIPADKNGGAEMYLALTGSYLPFSEKSLIEYDCFACREPESNNYAGDDAEDEDDINDVCEVAYLKSGKCEKSLPKWAFNVYKQKNNYACNYIDGIKVIREDGSIVTTQRNAPGHLGTKRAGAVMVVLFGAAFAGLSYYVYYLKNKFERASIEIE